LVARSPPSFSKTAEFSIVDAMTKVDIKCADDQPTRMVQVAAADELRTPSVL
jgi:hypothetical protein